MAHDKCIIIIIIIIITKKSSLVTLPLATLQFVLQKRTQLPHEKITLSNIIVLQFHMLLLYIYYQTVSKQCFLVGESIKVMYIFKL